MFTKILGSILGSLRFTPEPKNLKTPVGVEKILGSSGFSDLGLNLGSNQKRVEPKNLETPVRVGKILGSKMGSLGSGFGRIWAGIYIYKYPRPNAILNRNCEPEIFFLSSSRNFGTL